MQQAPPVPMPPPGNYFTCMVDNMVISGGAEDFRSGGDLDIYEVLTIAQQNNVQILSRLPDIDPDRVGGYIEVNAGAPLTPFGNLGFQIGGRYTQVEQGGQAFLTTGFFHRCNPAGGLSLKYGAVYDFLYDDFMVYHVGQVRVQFGAAFRSNSEIGAWFTIPTNHDTAELPVFTRVLAGEISRDIIEVAIKPAAQGHFFYRYVTANGADLMVFLGARGSPTGSFMYGGKVSWPLTPHWAVVGGGHMTEDDETFNAYLGIALYPGGRANVPNACGSRFMPYLPVANNTWLTTAADPTKFRMLFIGEAPL